MEISKDLTDHVLLTDNGGTGRNAAIDGRTCISRSSSSFDVGGMYFRMYFSTYSSNSTAISQCVTLVRLGKRAPTGEPIRSCLLDGLHPMYRISRRINNLHYQMMYLIDPDHVIRFDRPLIRPLNIHVGHAPHVLIALSPVWIDPYAVMPLLFVHPGYSFAMI